MGLRKGEVIEFSGEVSTTDGPWWYVRGHVPREEAEEAVHKWILDYEGDEYEQPIFGRRRLMWARWCFVGIASVEDGYAEFHVQYHKSPGAFPVTELTELEFL